MSISIDDILTAADSLQRGNNGGGKKPAKTCAHGHDKRVHGVQQWTWRNGRQVKNGIRCGECKRKQQRVYDQAHAA